MTSTQIENILAELVSSLGLSPVAIQPIAESGSTRRYYRVVTDSKSLIGTYSENVEENESFLYLSNHFSTIHLSVPQVLAVNAEHTCYVQSDFGDTSLFQYVNEDLRCNKYSDITIDYFKQTIEQLVRFQVEGHQGLDYNKVYPTPCFDRSSILEDLNYFKYYFVKPHAEIVFNETRLNKEFEQIADFLGQAPSDFFMYRDFQSRNIMIADGHPCFIDYQGGRKGPLQYDLVSLLYQVKAQMPQELRNTLIDYYKQCVSKYLDVEAVQFDKYLPYFIYLRLLQVLGAYGFRGLIQKKSHFIESIPFALKEIERHFATTPIGEYPELCQVLTQLPILNQRYGVDRQPLEGKLVVTVNSFSFKKGYPVDHSGNGGGFVFDCRALPNPGREQRFKTMTGRDFEVAEYLIEKPQTHIFLEHVKAIVGQSVDNYLERHFSNLMVSFGCTGGQHRSVFFAQSIADWLKATYPNIIVKVNHIEQKIYE